MEYYGFRILNKKKYIFLNEFKNLIYFFLHMFILFEQIFLINKFFLFLPYINKLFPVKTDGYIMYILYKT